MRGRKRFHNNEHGGQRQLVEGQQHFHRSRYVFKGTASDMAERGHRKKRGVRLKSSKS